MLPVARCALFVICCSVSGAWYSLFGALCVVRCLSCVVRLCVLFVMRGSLFVVC